MDGTVTLDFLILAQSSICHDVIRIDLCLFSDKNEELKKTAKKMFLALKIEQKVHQC